MVNNLKAQLSTHLPAQRLALITALFGLAAASQAQNGTSNLQCDRQPVTGKLHFRLWSVANRC
jgi:hypothetical protein